MVSYTLGVQLTTLLHGGQNEGVTWVGELWIERVSERILYFFCKIVHARLRAALVVHAYISNSVTWNVHFLYMG